MNEYRLTLRALVVVALSGVITAFVAMLAVGVSGALSGQVYRAHAQIALVPSAGALAGDKKGLQEALIGGQAARIASELLLLPDWQVVAARAAGLAPEATSITAGVVVSSNLIGIKADAPSPQAAEIVLDNLMKQATASPAIRDVVGNYDVVVTQPPAGTARRTGVPAGQVLTVVFLGGLLVGSGVALLVIRARNRDKATRRFTTGEHRIPAGVGRRGVT